MVTTFCGQEHLPLKWGIFPQNPLKCVGSKTLEMLCTEMYLGFESLTLRQKSPKNQGFSGFSFLPFCSKSAQNYGKNSLFFGKNKAILGILAYSNLKNQFFPSSSEISAHLLPKFTDSGSAIPLTIAFADDSFEV